MRLLFSFLLSFVFLTSQAQNKDSVQASVLVIPYMSGMHMSDSDQDISDESQMDLGEMRSSFRYGLVKAINKKFAEVYDTKVIQTNFVRDEDNDMDNLYHALVFEQDSTSPSIDPKKFANKDTSLNYGKVFKKTKPAETYIGVDVRDQKLLPELSEKYGANYFIFLNEFDIKTHFEDCINLAMKIYRRDFTVHYTIMDRTGKIIYGDAVTIHYPSNNNNVHEIIDYNFPKVADYVLESFSRAIK
ncbi:MAG: hypothetical protein IPP51_14345 [Bacteroidetes bacterium]|nr:hypothetical protein [Bacteroidota bacterium]